MSYTTALEKEVREAYVFLREKNNTIPSETLDFMLDASLEKIKRLNNDCLHNKRQYIVELNSDLCLKCGTIIYSGS